VGENEVHRLLVQAAQRTFGSGPHLELQLPFDRLELGLLDRVEDQFGIRWVVLDQEDGELRPRGPRGGHGLVDWVRHLTVLPVARMPATLSAPTAPFGRSLS